MDRGTILVIKHIDCEGLGTFEHIIGSKGFNPQFVNFGKGERIPCDINRSNALILLGGPIGVYETERYPFLKEEMEIIRFFYKEGKPVLGICLGAQLIAEALEGRVYKGGKKEIGWYKLFLTEDGRKDRIFQGIPDGSMVFQWHGDTFDLPDGAVRLSYSSIYPNQAFRLGENVYGLQFHLEVTDDMIAEWIKEYKEEVKGTAHLRPVKISNDTKMFYPNLKGYAEGFITRFIDLI